MRIYSFLVFFLLYFNIYAQDITCDDISYLFKDLIELHEKTLVEFCKSFESKVGQKSKQSVDNIIRDERYFISSYTNYFMSRKSSAKIIKKLAAVEDNALNCLKNEVYRYEIQEQFKDCKENIINELPLVFHKAVIKTFQFIKTKLKLN